jgi:hypothetical protein
MKYLCLELRLDSRNNSSEKFTMFDRTIHLFCVDSKERVALLHLIRQLQSTDRNRQLAIQDHIHSNFYTCLGSIRLIVGSIAPPAIFEL